MLKVYGSHFCDISEGLLDLKQFLMIRDANEKEFAEAKANGKLGVPFLVKDNGEVTHEWRALVKE